MRRSYSRNVSNMWKLLLSQMYFGLEFHKNASVSNNPTIQQPCLVYVTMQNGVSFDVCEWSADLLRLLGSNCRNCRKSHRFVSIRPEIVPLSNLSGQNWTTTSKNHSFSTTRPPLFWGENPKCFALYLGFFQNFHYTSTWLERGLFRKVWRKKGWLLFVCSKTFAQNDDGMNSWTLLMYRQLETPAKFEQFIRRFTPKPFWLVSQEQLVLPLDIWSQ